MYFSVIFIIWTVILNAYSGFGYHKTNENEAAKHDQLLQLRGDGYRSLREYNAFTTSMHKLLFPHMNTSMLPVVRDRLAASSKIVKRQLQTDDASATTDDGVSTTEGTYKCIVCRDMEYCPALTGLLIEEIYRLVRVTNNLLHRQTI